MKIAYLPYQPHCFAFGGFEIQMLNTFSAVENAGVNVSKLDYWDRNDDFEVLHAWGLGTLNYETIQWAKKKGKKIVVTALLPHQDTIINKIMHWGSYFVHSSKFSKKTLAAADKIVVLNEIQSELMQKHFFVPQTKIEIIPNVVNNIYFDKSKETSVPGTYILSTGNICERKNQLNLAKACKLLDIELILIGKVMDGEEAYGNELEKEIENCSKIKWIHGLKENSEELVEMYANCKGFALISHSEQQPISALEASVMNKPLILANESYAKQKYFNNAITTKTDVKSISNALASISKPIPNQYMLDCKAENIGLAYKNLYELL